MAEESQTVIYKSSRPKAAPILGVLLGVAFTGQALLVPDLLGLRWPVLSMGLAMIAISVVLQVMLGVTSIEVGANGIVVRSWRFVTSRFEWTDVTEFYPKRLLGRDHVGFTLSPGGVEKLRRNRYSGIKAGLLPDTYGLSAEDFAQQLNERRAESLGA